MKTRREMRKKRKARIRAMVRGTSVRPRLVVYRSNTAVEAQVVDDEAARTIVAKRMKGTTIPQATQLGKEIARALVEKKIASIVFDRGGYRYHGAIKALADALREEGLRF